MKQKDSLNKRLNTRLASLVMLSVLSVPWVASAAGNSVVANNMLPGNGQQGNVIAGKIEGGFNGNWTQGNQMNLHQTTQNAIVTWDSFSIGANASVTIRGDHDNFNMLNYVTGSESSQIYGKLNSYVGDKQGGNIYLVNPNGVQIGNSAEINVGSLHIANKKIDNINTWNENTNIANALKRNKAMTNAELMSLGYINANKLVFEGERVVIDMDRLSGLDTTKADALTIVRQPYDGKSFNDNRKYDIVLGSSTPKSEKAKKWGEYIEFADNVTGDRLQGTVQAGNPDAPNQSVTEFFTYRWIKDGKELEKIGKETGWGMGDHYALRYSIDLTGSDQTPIGATKDNAFKGKFDGLDNSIFGLSIDNRDNKYAATGLFGFTDGAIMGNVTLIAGNDGVSIQGGATDTGAFIGHAVNTTVKGVNSTLKVSGTNNVGGIIGYAKDDTGRTYSVADAAGSVQLDSRSSELSNLTNTGNVSGVSNVGGLVGYMNGGKLSNDEENRVQYKGSYNLGKITGIDKGSNYSYNIGGMIGKAENATVGGTKNTLINYNTVEGGYNVGGIVGSISNNTTVANASNEGVVKANGFTTDRYIYHTDYQSWKNYGTDMHEAEVRAANVGGIVGSSAGSELKDVTNKADVSSALVKKTTGKNDPTGFDHYAAGNVGGIVGRAEDSNITNANNVESNIRGAMNVGGIAGYFGSTDVNNEYKNDYRILNAINNGGDIMATGGIKSDGSFTYEITRSDYDPNQNKEKYITGNIGGIVGYLYGAPVRIEAGGNRGDVHTEADKSKLTAQAANVGGIVGKIDMPKATDSNGKVLTDKERLDIIKSDTSAAGNSSHAHAVVSSSYNTGNVTGYTNIGGIGGFAYNGSIAASYNVGDIHTTRADKSGTTPINMGGILGDSTEKASGRVIIYDTYNKGTIGDSSYTTYGRHVGGIVGRLSGIVEKSYNNGDIYNGLNVVGGIAGYWYSGYLKNVFNTGNITVWNQNDAPSQVGGIVGSVDLSGGNLSSGTNAALSISNAYNLGSLRSFKGGNKYNEVGGILGGTFNWSGTNNRLKISNAYTMGNIYVDATGGFVGDILGAFDRGTNSSFVDFENVYYIRPQENNGYIDLTSAPSGLNVLKKATDIDYDKLNDPNEWSKFSFSTQKDGTIKDATEDNWRMSKGSLPILNAFLSGSHNYFSDGSNWQEFMKDNEGANVQYGTAYDPLLTIINTKKDLSFNWSDMDLKNNGSLAVFGLPNADNTLRYTPGLTLNNVEITNSTHIFGGTIYSDGLLKLNAKDDLQGGLRFGMDSMLYGSDVVLNTNSSLELSGSVISTGNHNALSYFNPDKSLQHGININAADLTVYGKLITMGKEGESTNVIVPGINYGYGDSQAPDKNNVSDKTKAMTSQGINHAYRLKTATAKTGNITISTMENTLADGTHMSGSANLLYGNYKKGKIETKGNLTVSSSGNILVDSDLDIAGSINLSGNGSGSNITLDLSNIGSELQRNEKIKAIHAFIDAHATEATGIYGNTAGERPMKITFDLWDDDCTVDNIKGNLNYAKYDLKNEDGTTTTLIDKLKNLYVKSAGTTYNGDNIRNIIYAWISNAEELNSLQRVAENMNDRDALSYNFVLKNDIDASGLVDAKGNSTYNTIGGGTTAFTGTFDGDGHTIVGLQAKGGIFGKLGSGAVVKNINIASSVFTGINTSDSVGAVAAENNGGSISGISGYGNTIKGSGGYIGGLVGKNYGGISNSNDQSTVIAGAGTVAGGIAGVNGTNADKGGTIDNVQSNSAVTTGVLAKDQYASNLGGIVGKNEMLLDKYNINNVSAHGITGKTGNTQTSGGIVGTNEGRISNAYNESIIHGSENIGGVAGKNVTQASNSKLTELNDVANAVEIIGDAGSQNVGGLVGMQDHATTNQGRNTGAITGCTNVGGMVGYNTADSYLKNLENSPQATITGITNVGGIAGVNEGEISADNQLNLVNSGKIYGWKNVGGIAGKNSGKIDNVNSNINLYVIDEATRNALKGTAEIDANAQFFGGVTGENVGIITNATNRARVDAAQASYVGGIVGKNTKDGDKVGQLLGMGNSNEGFVIGKNYVGGVIGKNEVDITGTAEQSVGIVNSGTVIALAGGAGGIIGENSADITHVIMKNEGEVHGNASIEGSTEENGTGGIIGVNGYKADGAGANISNSSLMNRVNGNVSGVANVGGIIGINHGIITGGRDDNKNYYQYQIYNNGTIQAGSYDATNGTITAFAGENIGGLLGNNSGTLTAGYNTGVVKAEQSSNVGGIAGTNSGTLDQVFNSVVTVTKTETGATDANGRKLYNYTYTDGGAISGASNVGGIVGSNTAEGKLSNAYSTTAVAGASNVANIVGSNDCHVSNIYGYAANGITNVNGGTVSNSYIIKEDGTLKENGKDAKKLDSYTFDYKDTTWKLYDKRTNPLLKVFLTKVTVADDLQKGWVYDATNHLDIPGWINSGKLTTNDPANDAFAAYKNNSSLLQGEALKNVGDYSSWLWSGQIASGGDVGPNNLGYDFTVGDITVTKKVLNVTGNTVNRTYGDLLKNHDYALSINGFDGFNDAMKAELDGKVTIIDSQDTIPNSNDTGIITVGDEKRTKNKGTYEWQAGVKLDGSLTGNYEFQNDGVSSTTTTVHGKSNVLARKVYLNNINANLTYGSKDAINNHINGVVSIKDLANAIVYGDDVKLADGAVVNVKDGSSYATNKGGRNTADADTYADSLKIDNAMLTGDANKLGNYELVNNATGSITVDQATMHVKLNDVERTYGNTALINGTAYGVNGLTGNVNGDNYGAGHVNIGTVTGDGALNGTSTGKVTNDAGDTYKWNANVVAANDKLKQNYKLVVDGGASVVKQATLQVSLNDVVRTYGNATITSGGYSASGIEGLVNGDNYDASAITVNKTSDGAIAGVSGSKVTNDAGKYEWTGSASTTNEGLGKNYNLVVKGNGKSVVGKAKLNVGLSDVYRTYGNAKITSGSYSAGNITGLVNGDNYDASDFKVTVNSDGAIAGVTGDRVTNDHGDYTWSGTVEVANAGLNKNYDLVVNGNGNSYVGKAQLSVSLNDVVRTYGNATITSGGYGVSGITGLVNGDSYNVGEVKVTVTGDGALTGNTEGKVTNDAGNYEWTGSASTTNAGFGKNYNLVVTANGKSTVEKATLNVGLSDVVRTYGNATITSGGYSARNITGLVNGDSYDASAIIVNKTSDGAIDGVSGSKVTNDAGNYEWTGSASTTNAGLGKNYNLVVTANGKSTVEKATLNVGLSDVVRTYGNAAITSGGYSAGNITGLVNGDSYNAGDVKVTVTGDGATDGVSGSRVTNDAGNYEWTGSASTTNAGLDKNYNLVVTANGKSTVEKATLNVGLSDVYRTYGNAAITSGGYSAGNITGLVNGDSYNAGDVKVTVTGDGATDGVSGSKVTNDAGNYEWTGSASTTNAGLDKNYNLVVTANGKSTVEKAKLVVNLNDITRVYGNLDAKDYSNAFTFGANAGLVNGDNGLVINADKDGAIAGGTLTNVKKTNNVGSYEWNGTASGVDNLNTNYNVQINAGKSDVTKAKLVVNLNDITRVYGNLDAKDYSKAFTFGANAGLVNGDSGLVINANKDGAIAEGSVSDVKKTKNVGSYKWNGTASGVENLNTNYDVQINAGKSDVTKANLVVNLNDITRVYGNLDAKDYSNAFTFGANASLVNGDSGLVINANTDGAIAEGSVSDVKKTNNVGSYEWNGTASGLDNLNTNYDVTVNAGKSDVTKANLVVNLNDITRIYGNLDAKDYSNAFTFGNNAGLVNGDNGLVINANADGAIAGGTLTNVEKTNNVGSYEWNGTASGVDNLNTNYNVQINAGKSDVTKANLVVNLNDITRVYGNLEAKDYSKAYTFGENAGLVNGDNGLVINANKDGAIAGGTLTNVEKTNNVGNYEWNGTASGVDNLNTNYNVQINAGKSDVTKAKLTFVVDDKTITQGVPAKYTGKANGLTNGDTLAGIGVGGYELDSSVNPLIIGVYEDKIGVLINGSLHLTGSDGLLKNYKVEIDPGTLTVLPSFNPADDYWFGTAPWDKERNLRERKAEFHYVAGGMSL